MSLTSVFSDYSVIMIIGGWLLELNLQTP